MAQLLASDAKSQLQARFGKALPRALRLCLANPELVALWEDYRIALQARDRWQASTAAVAPARAREFDEIAQGLLDEIAARLLHEIDA